MTKVWITRTEPGASKTAERLTELGYEGIAAPLLTIGVPSVPLAPLPDDAILIITSQNALRVLSANTEDRCWPVMCVGDATAALATSFGYETVYSASGTSADIVPVIESHFAKSRQPFIHLSGDVVRGTITEDLTAKGYNAQRRIIYMSHSVAKLPEINLKALTYVMLYSPKAAACLKRFAPELAHVAAISISSDTDAVLEDMVFAARKIAVFPNEASMLRMLD